MTTFSHHNLSYRRVALALFAFFLGFYLLTTGGHTSSKDEELLFGVAENLVVWHNFALNAARPEANQEYSYYGPGQPVAAAPLYIVGRSLASLFPPDATPWVTRVVTLWFNPLVTAATVSLLFYAAILLGFRQGVAVATAFIYGLATLALPYSKTFFGEPFTALLPFASFVLVLHAQRRMEHTHPRTFLLLGLAGLLGGLSLTVKVHAALVLPFVALYAGIGDSIRPFRWKLVISRWVAWGIGAMIAILLLGWYQASLYGDPFSTGYGTSVFSHFNPKYFWYRLSGLVWSPGRGIIWYTPPSLLFPVALWLLWRRSWQTAILSLLVVAAHLTFYALLLYWHGGGSWGPRYLTIAMPFVILPLAAFLETLRGWRTPWRTTVLVIILLITIPIQIASVAIANEAFFSTKRNVHRDHFDPFDSAIAGHLALVAKQVRDYYDLHFAPNSMALTNGFAYSEGKREASEQLPRWSNRLPATIALRPPASATTLLVEMGINTCLPPPLDPTHIELRTHNTMLVSDTPCPPRLYHMVLPAQTTNLMLEAPLWQPSTVDIDRDGFLGGMLYTANAKADGQSLILQGDLVPAGIMPTGYVSIRRWTGDHRIGHWDFWWYYVQYSDLPAGPMRLLVGIWLTIAIGSLAWGAWNLRPSNISPPVSKQ